MIKLEAKPSGHYYGFIEWMAENIGEPGIDWQYVTDDTYGSGAGPIVSITVADPQKELLTIMRWS